MPTSFGFGPAALRSALAILPTFALMSPTSARDAVDRAGR